MPFKEIKTFKRIVQIVFVLTTIKLAEKIFEINLPVIRYFLIIVGGYLLIIRSINISESFKFRYKGFIKLNVVVLFLFSFYSIVIGIPELFDPNQNFIKLKQFIGEKAFLFSIPLLLFVSPRPEHWRYFCKFAYASLFLLLPFLLVDWTSYLTREESPEVVIRAAAGASGFLLLLSPYFRARKRYFIYCVYLLSLLLMLFHARRNMVLYFSSYFILYYYLNFFSSSILLKFSSWKTLINTIFLILVGGTFFLIFNLDFSLFFERASTGFESRDGIIEEFFLDMPPFSNDFYFGRGMYGTFFSRHLGLDVTSETGVGSGIRDLIENGYLQLILNFGFLFLSAFTIISLVAFTKGFFQSNNLIVKAMACSILINLIDMVGWGLPEISFRYFLVWLAFPYCLSYYFRGLSDKEIKKIIFT